MNFRKYSVRLASLALPACVLLASVSPAPAETLKLPKGKPAFSIELPDELKVSPQTDGGIIASTKADDYAVLVTEATAIHTKEAAKTGLKKFIEGMAKGIKIKDIELGDIEDQSDENGQFFALRGDGKKADDTAVVLSCHIFEATKGRWFILVSYGAEAESDAHEKDYTAIVNSIETIK